jgi:DNA-binding transcriptional regulator GbsR (MarR family)
MEIITEVLSNLNKPLTISEMQEADEKLATLSNQKISALLTKLINSNKVVKTTDKRKSYFSIAD